MSSSWMARVLAEHEGVADGLDFGRAEIAHPLDADDFGRCVRFLDAVPGLRRHVARMADGNGCLAALGFLGGVSILSKEQLQKVLVDAVKGSGSQEKWSSG